MERRISKQVNCGGVLIGGNAPVSVQSMTNTDTRDPKATLEQIRKLAAAGCQIIRCAVPDLEAAEALAEIKKNSPLPVVADIHFDHRLAIAAIKSGADKVRINPGNIGGDEGLRAVIRTAKEHGIPLRVGVNSGSVGKDILAKYGHVTPEALAESALVMIRKMEEENFDDLVISVKASGAELNYKAHLLLADKNPYAFHVGLTEAGTPNRGKIISSIGIGSLLMQGIGDTIRVSLTGDPTEEVYTAWEILRSLDLAPSAIRLISCPTCGRTRVNLLEIAEQVEKGLPAAEEKRRKLGLPGLQVAVMGCEVNGPGEAREADLGVACGKNEGLLFRKGEILRKVPAAEIAPTLLRMLEDWN